MRISGELITNVANQIEALESKHLSKERERKGLSCLSEIFVNYEKEKSEGYRIRFRVPYFEVEEPNMNYSMFHVTWTIIKFNRNQLGMVSAYVM